MHYQPSIDYIQTVEGRYLYGGGKYQYGLKDHLGNVRVMVEKASVGSSALVQENEYYAFGLNVDRQDVSPQNKYLYNGKEMQEDYNLNQYDYGARFYDPVVAKWGTIDPLAEQDRRWSPYGYAFNNPMRFTDPDGMWPDDSGPGDEHGTGNGLSLIENVYLSSRDMLVSGLTTLKNGIQSLFNGGSMNEASVTYHNGQASITNSPLTSTGEKLRATGTAILNIAGAIPANPETGVLAAEANGVKSSVATVVKDAVHANSKLSTAENTLYRLETKGGQYLKTGITSKVIPEKRYLNEFMKDKVMKVLDKGSRADLLKKERDIVEKNPGPLNRERWAGKQANQN